MAKFNVALTVYVPICSILEVEADNADEAEAKAAEQVSARVVHDFDGNRLGILMSDITVDSVEEKNS